MEVLTAGATSLSSGEAIKHGSLVTHTQKYLAHSRAGTPLMRPGVWFRLNMAFASHDIVSGLIGLTPSDVERADKRT